MLVFNVWCLCCLSRCRRCLRSSWSTGSLHGWWRGRRNTSWISTETWGPTRPSWGCRCRHAGKHCETFCLLLFWIYFGLASVWASNSQISILSLVASRCLFHLNLPFKLLKLVLGFEPTNLWAVVVASLFSHTVKRQTATRSEVREMPNLPRGGRDELGREEQVSSRRVLVSSADVSPAFIRLDVWFYCSGWLIHSSHMFFVSETTWRLLE